MTNPFKSLVLVCAGALALAAGVAERVSGRPAAAEAELSITISPSVLVLHSEGEWVTVHTNIGLGQVDTGTVALSGLPVARTKADAQGNLVAKFHVEDVKAMVAPPVATLELTLTTTDGRTLSASDTIEVKE